MSRHSRRKQPPSRVSIQWVVNGILLLVYAVLVGMTNFLMYSHHILAFRHLNLFYSLIVIGVFIVSLVLTVLRKGKTVVTALTIIFSILSLVMLFAFKSLFDVAGNMNKTSSYSEVEMSVVVPSNSSISDVGELTSIQAPVNADRSNIEALLSKIKSDKGIDLQADAVDSYQKAYENLIDGSSQAMVLNSAYSSLLDLSYNHYKSHLKTIYTYKLKKSVASDKKSGNTDVFNIYISGIDTYGSISTASRSDVNIIMTVNMKTHKILMTTTPRDSYVQIPDGEANQYDKLTHAGIYGVETSEKTLDKLYGITIDYYARINFTSFLKLIDAIGGVTVYNDQAFTSLHGNYRFDVGNVSLDSDKALGFVRERYSLEKGDYDRGNNQLKVIQAIVNKLTSFNSVSNYSSIISTLTDSVQTDMSLDTMMRLANAQLDSGEKFTMTSQEVTGTGSTGTLTSYAMPNARLYMIQLNPSSVNQAKQAIKKVMSAD